MTVSQPSLAEEYEVIVVGGGVAGSAAALRAAQYMHRTLWIRGSKLDAKRSRAQWVYNIDNMIGVHDGIVRKKVRRLLRGDAYTEARSVLDQAPHMPISTRDIVDNVIDRIEADYADHVDSIGATAEQARHLEDGTFEVDVDGRTIRAAHVVLATGVMDRQPKIKATKRGEIKDDIKWIYPAANREQVLYCIRCEGHLTRGTRTAIIGSSEAAAQIGMMLHERYGSTVAVLTNGEEPAWSENSQRLLEVYKIEVANQRICDVDSGRDGLQAIELEDGQRYELAFALVAMGLYVVYNQLAVEIGAELGDEGRPDDQRHVQVDARGETSVANLFAVGDMAQRPDEPIMKQVYTSQEYAVRAVDVIDSRMRRARRIAALGILE